MSSAKEKLNKLVIGNEFITKPRLIKLFKSLVNDVERESFIKNLSLQNVSEIDLLMQFDEWLTKKANIDYDPKESKKVMIEFLSSR